MKCSKPETSEKLVQYVERLLSTPEAEEVARHLLECPACRDEEASLKTTTALLKMSRQSNITAPSPCPDENLLVTFTETPEKLKEGDRRSVEAHVRACRACSSMVSLLGELDRELDLIPSSPPLFISMPETVKKEAERLYGRPQAGPWQKFMQLFQIRPRYSLLSALAVTLLIVGVLTCLLNDVTYKSHTPAPPAAPQSAGSTAAGPGPASDIKADQNKKIFDEESQQNQSAPTDQVIKNQVAQAPQKIVTNAVTGREKESVTGAMVPPGCNKQENAAKTAPMSHSESGCGGSSASGRRDMTAPESCTGGFRAGEKTVEGSGGMPPRLEKKKEGENDKAPSPASEPQQSADAGAMKDRSSGYCKGMAKDDRSSLAAHRPEVSLYRRDEEKKRLEREMAARAAESLNRIPGPGKAAVDITIRLDENSSSLSIKGIDVRVRSTAALSEAAQARIRETLFTCLKLEAKRDTVTITDTTPPR